MKTKADELNRSKNGNRIQSRKSKSVRCVEKVLP